MNTQKHKWILYLITVTIVVTIGVQLYWNYKNYQQNKQRVLNEIQISLDNAVDNYFADLTKKSSLAFVDLSTDTIRNVKAFSKFISSVKIDRINKSIDINGFSNTIDTIPKNAAIFEDVKIDTNNIKKSSKKDFFKFFKEIGRA